MPHRMVASNLELNDHKAGMMGLDKDKINKIIMEASKGEFLKCLIVVLIMSFLLV